MSLLSQIHTPADLKGLTVDQLEPLAKEIREAIFAAVSTNGGHLASNLGVVELTLALHYVYDFGPHPTGPDKLLFDVGHQCYPHKMLTGRAGQFDTLRKKGSVSGFPNPEESPYDLFAVGHAGTAISTAVGVARGDQLQKIDSQVVAVVGDASIVNGMSFEGLNNAGTLNRQLLIVLNDNGMSISEPQGAFAEYLERVRVSTTYEEFKRLSGKLVHTLPGTVGNAIESAWDSFRRSVKGAMWHGALFETFGLKYMGPVDGHDLPGLVNFLAEIKHVNRPMLLHVKTRKGEGYEICQAEPTKMHSPAAFVMNGCRVEHKASNRNWTTAFADALIEVGKKDPQVIALTAAMPDGTGVAKFSTALPNQAIDTGICESHLMAMAAGMNKTGLKPVAAVYSTFVQRCYDQIWQEVVLNGLKVVIAMDRAGYVGDDGAVHHGFMDQSFLRPMPGVVLMAPSDEAELKRCLALAMALDGPAALRYPRDAVPATHLEELVPQDLTVAAKEPWKLGVSRTLRHGADAAILSYGALTEAALLAAAELAEDGIELAVIDARFCKPIDERMLKRELVPDRPVLTLEDHALANGFGSAVLEAAVSLGLPTRHVTRLGHPDRLIGHATRPQQLAEAGLDVAGIAASVRLRDCRGEIPCHAIFDFDIIGSGGNPPVHAAGRPARGPAAVCVGGASSLVREPSGQEAQGFTHVSAPLWPIAE
ncbi:MAG: 1-deoxy-D-xylulose-5-phosphate synthase [Tepidisphaeraceae bacterium]